MVGVYAGGSWYYEMPGIATVVKIWVIFDLNFLPFRQRKNEWVLFVSRCWWLSNGVGCWWWLNGFWDELTISWFELVASGVQDQFKEEREKWRRGVCCLVRRVALRTGGAETSEFNGGLEVYYLSCVWFNGYLSYGKQWMKISSWWCSSMVAVVIVFKS